MLVRKVIRIAYGASVFIVEDSEQRQRWFSAKMPDAQFASTAEDAIQRLASFPFDVVLLDHDLEWADAAGQKPGSGVRVAHFLAKNGFQGQVVIHSVNEAGAAHMKRLLPYATVAPFGSFEIELV